MTQVIQPCGTPAAYRRHRRNGEEACAKCKEARSEYAIVRASVTKKPREFNPRNREMTAMDAALEADPPVIVWRNGAGGVKYPISVHGPYPDSGHNGTKDRCKRNHPFTKENTIWDRGWRLCRTCKNEARRVTAPECTDESLLAAARTEI